MEENSSSGTCQSTNDVLKLMRPEIDALISAGLANITFTFDLMKHLATVATGVILVLAAFHEKFASGANLRVAIPIATVSLLVTLLYSVKVCMAMWNQQTRFGLLHAVNRRCLTEEMVRPIARRWALEYDFFVRRSGRLRNFAQAVDFCQKMGAQNVFRYAEEGDYIHEPPMNTASFLTAFFEVNSYEHAIQTVEELTRLSPIATS